MSLIMRAVVILSTFALASATAAQPLPGGGGAAPSGMITQFNADQFAQLLTAAGLTSKAQMAADNKTPIVVTQFAPNVTGIELGTLCDNNGACGGYQIFVDFSNAQAIGDPWTDAWNSRWLFVKAVKSGTDLIFEMDVLATPGVTPNYIVTSVKLFAQIVANAASFNP